MCLSKASLFCQFSKSNQKYYELLKDNEAWNDKKWWKIIKIQKLSNCLKKNC